MMIKDFNDIDIKSIKNKSNYGFEDLCVIMKILRSPNGCEWDKVQTHESIKENAVEEAYEVFDAIENKNAENLKEELGDLLLQVIFHSEMEEETGGFNINDVIDNLCKKLVFRHPHVFGDTKAQNADEALDNWNNRKMVEKNQSSFTQTLKAVSRHFPALLRAQKVQKRAKKAGFDWDDKFLALKKVYEEADELKAEMEKQSLKNLNNSDTDNLNNCDNYDKLEEELGDLIFSAVNVSRFINVNSEDALHKATEKFINRFGLVEEKANQKGIDMEKASLEVLDRLWEEAKKEN